jgi:transcriptional regulator with XRE-family HTH domain
VKVTQARVLKDVGRRVAELRLARGLTQEALAERLDVAARWVQAVEGGKENLTLGTLATFANALKAPMVAFFEPPTIPKARPGRPKRAKR